MIIQSFLYLIFILSLTFYNINNKFNEIRNINHHYINNENQKQYIIKYFIFSVIILILILFIVNINNLSNFPFSRYILLHHLALILYLYYSDINLYTKIILFCSDYCLLYYRQNYLFFTNFIFYVIYYFDKQFLN